MPQKRSTRQLALTRRRQRISELRLQGWTQQAIAEELGTAQTTVSHDLRLIGQEWRKATLDDFEQMRAEALQKLDRLEREAWQAWEQSRKPAQSAVVEIAQGQGKNSSPSNEADGDPPAPRKTRKTVKHQVGDARFLQVVQSCIAARRALVGLDAPRKVAATGVEGRTITLSDLLGRIHGAAPEPPSVLLDDRSNILDVEAEFARRAPRDEGERSQEKGERRKEKGRDRLQGTGYRLQEERSRRLLPTVTCPL